MKNEVAKVLLLLEYRRNREILPRPDIFFLFELNRSHRPSPFQRSRFESSLQASITTITTSWQFTSEDPKWDE